MDRSVEARVVLWSYVWQPAAITLRGIKQASLTVWKQFLINAFGGAGMGTEHRQFHAQCTPRITANEHVMEQLSLAEPRYSFFKTILLSSYGTKNAFVMYTWYFNGCYPHILYRIYTQPNIGYACSILMGYVDMSQWNLTFCFHFSPCAVCHCLHRYLVWAVLIPFKFQASQVELRVLPHLLQDAPAAFPKLLAVGKWLEGVDEDTVCSMRDSVLRSAGGKLESRLATQYALTILCAQKVKIHAN